MAITGHKTESIYRRYDIIAERDLAAARMDQYLTGVKHRTGTLLDTPECPLDSQVEETCFTSGRKLLN